MWGLYPHKCVSYKDMACPLCHSQETFQHTRNTLVRCDLLVMAFQLLEVGTIEFLLVSGCDVHL